MSQHQKGPVNKETEETQHSSKPESAPKATRRCFVISPIGAEGSDVRTHANDVFKYIIEPAWKGFGIYPVRSDQLSEAGRITDQMFREIVHADLCMAVLTGLNPNVFYELAVAQCAARPTIILIEKGQELPFDVKDLRTVQYEMDSISKLVEGRYAKRVEEMIKTIKDKGWSVDSLFEEYGYHPKGTSEMQIRRMLDESRPDTLVEEQGKTYVIPEKPNRKFTVVRGDIVNLKDPPLKIEADVIVNLLDVDLKLGRYHEASISGTLRYLDADKTAGRRIKRDTLEKNLEKAVREKKIIRPVVAGTVVDTPTNRLQEEQGFRYVFHVGAMEGSVGKGYSMREEVLETCVRNAYRKFNEVKKKDPSIKSMVFPMLGAASSRLDAVNVARKLLGTIVKELKRGTQCQTTYLVEWLDSHRIAVDHVLKELVSERKLEEKELDLEEKEE